MKALFQRLEELAPGSRYWTTIFAAFFCTYLLPLGSGPTKAVFYLGILLPALLFSTKREYRHLTCSRHLLFVITLCAYALVRAPDLDTALDVLKFIIALLALSLGALKLPTLHANRAALFFIIALFVYVLANAVHQSVTQGWMPGLRLQPLFGNLKSVIFCADLIVSVLVVYSWCCITMRDYRSLFIANTIVIVSILWLLQSRSALPVWLGSMAIMLACTAPTKDRMRILLYLTLLLIAVAVLSGGALPALLQRGDSYRFEIWSGYLNMMRGCSTLFGCGWGIEQPFTTNDGTLIVHPHSMYVQHLYWGGIAGFMLLLLALGIPLIAGIRQTHYAAWALLPGCIALAFDGKSFISQPNERWFLVTVPLALLIAGLARKTTSSTTSSAHSADQ